MVHTDSEWLVAQTVVAEALKTTRYANKDLERLNGGFINFAFRANLIRPLEKYGDTVVVKLTDEKTKLDVTLPKSRSYYEHHVLSQDLPSTVSRDETSGSPPTIVRVPKALAYFPDAYLQIHEDLLDTKTLKANIVEGSLTSEFATICGKAIGKWAILFHKWGRHDDQEELRKVLTNYTTALQFKYRLSIGRLPPTIEKFPDMLTKYTALFQEVSERMSKFAAADGDASGIIHGDFWPGNLVFAKPTESLQARVDESHANVEIDKMQFIYVLDWELCHISSFVVDLGAFFAELYFVYVFKESEVVPFILDGFLESYGPISNEHALNIMICFGVHLIIWPPRTEWSTYPQMKDTVQYGCDVLENVCAGNSEWFKTGFFHKLFSGIAK